jgi:hypothetical protein
MSLSGRIRKLFGIERIPLSPDADHEVRKGEEVTAAVRAESQRNSAVQTELQINALNDINHTNGIRLAIAGTLSQLQRDQKE